MPFVWSIGTIIGPSIGGYFASPAETFPEVFLSNGIFAVFPYLLPNLICALLLLISIVAACFFLGETHPDMQPWSTQADLSYTSAMTPLIPASGAMANAHADLSTESYGTFDSVTITDRTAPSLADEQKQWSRSSSPRREKVFNKNVVMLIAALGMQVTHASNFCAISISTNKTIQLHLPLNDL
jgi:MFS family permease